MYPIDAAGIKALIRSAGNIPPVPEESFYRRKILNDHQVKSLAGVAIDVKKGSTILLANLKTLYVMTFAGTTHVLGLEAGTELACD